MLLISSEKILDMDIIHISCGKTWDSKDTQVMVDCALRSIKEKLLEVQQIKKRAVFLCDCKTGTLPPPGIVLQIVTFLLSIGKLINEALLCTIMNAKDKDQTFWLDQILKVYRPQKPLYIIYSDKDIKTKIEETLSKK